MGRRDDFKDDVMKNINSEIEKGNVFAVNEIAANMMAGIVLMAMVAIIILCWLLNEFGVFTADKPSMRIAVILALIVEMPILILNMKLKGAAPWIKMTLLVDLLIEVSILTSVLGHNTYLALVIPVILSIRYCEKKLTKIMAILSYIAFIVSTVICAFLGIPNMNSVKLNNVELVIDGQIKNAVIEHGFDKGQYLVSEIVNDLIPRLLILTVICIVCYLIAKRNKEAIDLQSEVALKSSRIETELSLATEIQTSMLPCIFPAFPEHAQLDLYAMNFPAKEVGGDFYDYFKIDDDHVALVMADVSGKGIGAALFMTISKIVIKNQLLLGIGPAKALTEANVQISENNSAGLFVTTWAGVYEISTGTLRYTNAGHNPPIVKRKGQDPEYIKGIQGIVVAGFDTTQYKEAEIKLEKDDEIFLYTDGVTEATNLNNELYGEDRLLKQIAATTNESLEEQLNDLKADIDKFVDGAEQFDDITIMAMRVE